MEPMNKTAFRPNKKRYLVQPDPVVAQETKIEGSQYTIDVARDIHEKPSEGTVIAKGKDCTEYEIGAKCLYGKFSGYEQLFDGTQYLILAETEILGERLVTPFDEPERLVAVTPRTGQTVADAYREMKENESRN
jgi:co-chaperonin GroES (HSP10)